MSSPRRPFPHAEVRGVRKCMCADGGTCSTFAPGHATHLIQARLAAATPSGWVDALVTRVTPEGTVTVTTLDDASVIALWNAAAGDIEVGSPVALHEHYHLLADGGRRFNVVVG